MPRTQSNGSGARGASTAATALLAALSLSCGHKGSDPELTKPVLTDAATTVLRLAPSSSSSAAPAQSSKPDKPTTHAPGPTAEAVLEEARAHVEEAVRHADAKDVCHEALPLLDVSYSIVRTKVPLDEHTLGIFAACAAHHQRWRLLRDLADAIAAGERKLETTYLLPRALIGEGEYDLANTLAKATLRAWPTDAEAYNAAALAALRVKDWEGGMKAADQALLLQRKHNVSNEVTALAHGLRGAALLRMGKLEEGVHEIEAAKAHEAVLRVTDVSLEAARAAKAHGVLATVDLSTDVYPGLWPLYTKKVAPLSGLVTVVLQNLSDKPQALVVEVALDEAGTAAESETVVKGHPLTVVLTPQLKAGSPLLAPKAAEARDITVSVSGGPEHGLLYRETTRVTFHPVDAMPKVVSAHAEDLRSAFPIEAAWVTPNAPPVVALVEAAKTRLQTSAKKFDGMAGLSLPQAKALWDELRTRGVSFHRDPRIDSELHESTPCKLPSEILESGTGNALESSVLLASMLEAIGLDVILVRTPGHRMVAWLGTPADLAAPDTAASTVKSPRGQAFFLETTTVGEGPFDAAVLRGAAAWVAATNDGSVGSGRAQVESLSELRHRGVVATAP